MSDWPGSVAELSELEHVSLRAFVESCAEDLAGRVLDYGCGKQPYREVVEEAGGIYHGYDRQGLLGGTGGNIGDTEGRYDTILCTQVIEYLDDPYRTLRLFRDDLIRAGGALILTGPTSWIEPPGHLHNYTLEGIRRLLTAAAWKVERLESRGHIGPGLSIGYGAVAHA